MDGPIHAHIPEEQSAAEKTDGAELLAPDMLKGMKLGTTLSFVCAYVANENGWLRASLIYFFKCTL
jgi:hypothetical protein